MKSILLHALLLSLCVSNAWACGDKFLVYGRTVRADDANAISARVLIFQEASVQPYTEIHSTLKVFGHKVKVARSQEEATNALQNDDYDAVVVKPANIASIDEAIRKSSSGAQIVLLVPEGEEEKVMVTSSNLVLVVPSNSTKKGATKLKPTAILDVVAEAVAKKGSVAMRD